MFGPCETYQPDKIYSVEMDGNQRTWKYPMEKRVSHASLNKSWATRQALHSLAVHLMVNNKHNKICHLRVRRSWSVYRRYAWTMWILSTRWDEIFSVKITHWNGDGWKPEYLKLSYGKKSFACKHGKKLDNRASFTFHYSASNGNLGSRIITFYKPQSLLSH